MGTTIFSTICYLVMNTILLFNFTKDANMQHWSVVDDSVMGGVSAGKMGVDGDGHGLFQGHVSLANNGGFSSIRYKAGSTKLTGYSKFVLVVKGDGKAYQFRVKTNSSDYYSYTFLFNTTHQWQTIEIPFSSIAPSFRGRTPDMANFPGDSLEEIGFLTGNKKAEDFKLVIDCISVQ